MNKKLLGNRILVEVDNIEEKTASGIIISKEKEMGDFMTGKVIAVGEGKRFFHKSHDQFEFEPISVEVENTVIFQYGRPFMLEGKNYSLVAEEDIIYVM